MSIAGDLVDTVRARIIEGFDDRDALPGPGAVRLSRRAQPPPRRGHRARRAGRLRRRSVRGAAERRARRGGPLGVRLVLAGLSGQLARRRGARRRAVPHRASASAGVRRLSLRVAARFGGLSDSADRSVQPAIPGLGSPPHARPRGSISAPTRRRLSRRGRSLLAVVAATLAVLFLSLRGIAAFFTDYLWFDSLDLSSVWSGLLTSRVLLFIIFSVAAAAVVWLNLTAANRLAPRFRPVGPEEDLLERYFDMVGRLVDGRACCIWASPPMVGFIAGIVDGPAVEQLVAVHERRRLRREGPAVRHGHRLLRVQAAVPDDGRGVVVRDVHRRPVPDHDRPLSQRRHPLADAGADG